MSDLQKYVSLESPNLRITLVVNGMRKLVQFSAHSVDLDADSAAVLDELLAKNVNLRFKIQKADRARAEALAKAHASKQFGGTAKGGMTSDLHKQTAAQAEALVREGATEEQAAALTETANKSGISLLGGNKASS